MGAIPRLTETRINHYFDLARNACFYSDCNCARLGAVLVYKNKVMSVGWNNTKTNPLQQELNQHRNLDSNVHEINNSLHAEVTCLLRARGLNIEYSKSSLFVYRIKKDGSSGLSRPCKGCMSLIKELGIKNIYYSTESGWAYERIE